MILPVYSSPVVAVWRSSSRFALSFPTFDAVDDASMFPGDARKSSRYRRGISPRAEGARDRRTANERRGLMS